MAVIATVTDAFGAGVEFDSRIFPILEAKCFECHGPAKAEGGLRLDGAASILRGGKSGPAIVAGDAEGSLLYSRVESSGNHDGLVQGGYSALERAFLKRWIADGAEFGSWAGVEAGEAPPMVADTGAKPDTEPKTDSEPGAVPGGEEVAMVPKADTPPPVTPPPTTTTPAVAQTVNFEKHVLPVLRSKCFECHKETYQDGERLRKPKGGLRLDAARGILMGSSDGPVVKVGDPEDSSLYTRTTLPTDDDDVMPPKGDGTPLSDAEKQVLKTWIEEGANFSGWVGNEKGLAAATAEPSSSGPTATDLLAQQVKGASGEALRAVAATGALITQVAIGNPLLRVEYVTEESKIGNEHVAAIAPLAANVTELDLSETAVTDEGLKMLSDFDKLTYLDLHDTEVTDATVDAIQGLVHIEYLNLYGTGVTDASLPKIAALRKLKAVYLWKTGVTAGGAENLRKALPDAKINL